MEVMTYILWMLLLLGSVVKNLLLSASVPNQDQALPAAEKRVALVNDQGSKNKNADHFNQIIRLYFHRKRVGWLDTS